MLAAVVSVLCSLTLTDWGSWAAIIAAAIVVIGAIYSIGRWCCNQKRIRNPVRLIEYKLQDDIGKKDLFDSTVKLGTADAVIFKGQSSLKGTMKLLEEKVYLLFLNLSPQIPRSIHSVNLRFLGAYNKPQVIDLQDANQETYQKYTGLYEGDGESWGWKGLYSTPIYIANGKNLYYYACFTTRGTWKGQLSLRFYFVGEDARSVEISCIVGNRK